MEILLRRLQISLPRLVLHPELGTLLVERPQKCIRSESVLAAHFYFRLSTVFAVNVVDFLFGLNDMHVLQIHSPESNVIGSFW